MLSDLCLSATIAYALKYHNLKIVFVIRNPLERLVAQITRGFLSFLDADVDFIFPDKTFSKRKKISKPQTVQDVPNLLKWYIAREWIDKVKKMNRSMELDLGSWVEALEQQIAQKRWYYPIVALFHKLYFCIPYNLVYSTLNPLRIKFRVHRSRRNILRALSLISI